MGAPLPADPGVYISSSQMYQEMRSLHDAVGRVETKLDGLRDGYVEVRKDVADHENRLRSLERARWPLPTIGALAGVGGAVAAAVALFQH